MTLHSGSNSRLDESESSRRLAEAVVIGRQLRRRDAARRFGIRVLGALAVVAACFAFAVWANKERWRFPETWAPFADSDRIAAWLAAPNFSVLPGLPARWNPGAPLTLQEADGPFTRWKIAQLEAAPAVCREWLATAPGLVVTPLPDRESDGFVQGGSANAAAPDTNGCGWHTASRVSALGGVRFSSPFTLTCGATVALARWEHLVVQPTASAVLGSKVVRIEHLGSYACRTIAGSASSQGRLSQHAHANALDIAAFDLSDGRRISVLRDWQAEPPSSPNASVPSSTEASLAHDDASGPGPVPEAAVQPAAPSAGSGKAVSESQLDPAARFLQMVQGGACHDFSAVLGPGYNAAHRNHFHLDRGPYRVCR